jgi:hypothetical protein
MDRFAGLDVSVKDTSVCIVDETGRIRSASSDRQGLSKPPVEPQVRSAPESSHDRFSNSGSLAMLAAITAHLAIE